MTLEQLKFMLELINMVSSWKGDKRRFDKKKSELRKVIEAFGFDCIVSLKHEIQGLARGGKMKKIFIKRAVEMQSGEDTSKHQNIEDETEYHRRRV